MSDEIDFDSDAYQRAYGVPPPPGIPSDMIGPAAVWTEQLLVALQTAANADDPMDIAAGEAGYAERQALAQRALTGFPENEAQGEAQFQEVSKMAEQIPQMASGIAGGIAGALGGALKPLTELPQQLAQSMQGLMQQGMGALENGGEDLGLDAFEASALDDEFGGGAGGLDPDTAGGGGGGGGFGGTVPMSTLGPAATPTGATAPTSGRATMMSVAPSVPASVPGHMGGMGGYPMMPPGAMARGGTGADNDDKTATKKVSVPSVKNGAPVQGRVSAPPTAPTVSKQVEGKTVATRRIVVPNDKKPAKTDDDAGR